MDFNIRYAVVCAREDFNPIEAFLSDIIAFLKSAEGKGRPPVKMTFFLDGNDPIAFYQTKARVKEVLDAHFCGTTPLMTFISQRPLQGVISVEMTLLEGHKNLVYKSDNLIKYCKVETDCGTWLFLGIDQDQGKEGDFYDLVFETFDAVKRILEKENMSFKNVIRQWNYIENITRKNQLESGAYQYYQVFNDIRALFYGASNLRDNFPAATGIGCNLGGFAIEIIALDHQDTVKNISITSPVQHNAYDYSRQVLVGDTLHPAHKQPPLFERAKMIALEDSGIIYVSGTAAINGESSVEVPDIAEQTKITIGNIFELLTLSNLSDCGVTNELENIMPGYIRAYLKTTEQKEEVEKTCKKYFGNTPLILLQADVCRSELLVEIEAAFDCRFYSINEITV